MNKSQVKRRFQFPEATPQQRIDHAICLLYVNRLPGNREAILYLFPEVMCITLTRLNHEPPNMSHLATTEWTEAAFLGN